MMSDRVNILVVDDKPNNLHLLSEILNSEGYKARKVLDGAHALDAAQLDPPDLILLDIMMPGMDGYEVCQRLKADSRTQHIPIIFLSALDDIGDKIRAFSTGGVDYITKPFRKEEVLARVKTHLQIQSLTKTLQDKNQHLVEEIEHRKTVESALKKALDELKAAQEQMIAREKLAALGTLTAGIAHELRNPLNFVNNYAESSVELTDELLEELEAISESLGGNHLTLMKELLIDLRENAVAIHQHGQRAERIISSMMQHARMENSSLQLSDLNGLLDEAIDLAYHSRRVQSAGFTVVFNKLFDTSIGQIQLLPNELSRALINLMDNALYAIQRKQQEMGQEFTPTLSVTTRNLNEQVEIRIRDNGIGIPANYRNKIFEPFFTTKPTGEGTGLGLSITYEIIVKQHQGSLQLESEPGVYTEFIITLPVNL
ncbi:MAG TPA: response regulator [Crinalium sp.]|jgi:signal transduction histidine kinase